MIELFHLSIHLNAPFFIACSKEKETDGYFVDDRTAMVMEEDKRTYDEPARTTTQTEAKSKEDDNDSRTNKDMSTCERCGKSFSGRRGVKIHQGKKKRCGSTSKACSRTKVLNKTPGDEGQDTHHRTNITQAAEEHLPETEIESQQPEGEQPATHANCSNDKLPLLTFPKANSKEWKELDEDIDKVLQATLRGPASRKVEKMSTIVYEMSRERFGVEEKHKSAPKPSGPNRRQRKIAELRVRLRELTRQYKIANEFEKTGLSLLRDGLRKELKSIRRAERLSKKRREKKKSFVIILQRSLQIRWRYFDKTEIWTPSSF